ncbi:hypothetical protein BH11BAC1_BH11BAC1_25200 [soil metagenome]
MYQTIFFAGKMTNKQEKEFCPDVKIPGRLTQMLKS